jgi:hypothetical protein
MSGFNFPKATLLLSSSPDYIFQNFPGKQKTGGNALPLQ